jgi:DUF1680 family protein
LYVNLFISSEIHLEDKKVKIRQETDFPKSNKTRLYFEEGTGEFLKIHIRVPYWVAGAVTAVVNGSETYTSTKKRIFYNRKKLVCWGNDRY